MGLNTHISWTKHSWNPWVGCDHVSAGCLYCYAHREMNRFKRDFETVTRTTKPVWRQPYGIRRDLAPDALLHERLTFVCSWSDFFHPDADAWRAEAWQIMRQTPEVIYQIPTKRPNRVLRNLPPDWGESGYPNVWLGVSVEDQEQANARIWQMMDWRAVVRFVSFEPLLTGINLHEARTRSKKRWEQLPFEWAIIGGESGNEEGDFLYRPCEMEWLTTLANQLQRQHVATWMKQTGTHLSLQLGITRHGRELPEWPMALRVQQFPPLDAFGHPALK